ncbi:hypothetical protein C8Q80DRAFT_1353357 [Daedaleopsis nitida]|nr:hypothetical protein C8Q80DRAFT_1353357 [Daedaleopsis nitida]
MFDKCLGCGARLPGDARARGQHKRHCAKMKTGALAQTLRERHAEQARKRELREQERAEREMADAAQAIEVDVLAGAEDGPEILPPPPPLQPELPQVSSRGRVRKSTIQRFKDFLPTSYAGPSTPQLAAAPAEPSREPSPAPSIPVAALQAEPDIHSPCERSCTPSQQNPVSPNPVSPVSRQVISSDEPEPPLPTSESWAKHRSSTTAFGLYRDFPVKPKRDPEEEEKTIHSVCDPTIFGLSEANQLRGPLNPEAHDAGGHDPSPNPSLDHSDFTSDSPPPWAPFPNVSTFDMLYWQYNSSNTKSNAQVNLLTRCVFQEPGFDITHLAHFDAAHEAQRLDEYIEEDNASPFSAKDGWIRGSVNVRLPKEGVCYVSEVEAPVFTVEDVWHRSLPQVIRAALQRPGMKNWHMIPHKLFAVRPLEDPVSSSPSPFPHRSPSSLSQSSSSTCSSSTSTSTGTGLSSSGLSFSDGEDGIRVHTEIYNSDAAIEEYDLLLAQPREEGDPLDLEYSMSMLCLYSDSTRLTNFGSASMWPLSNYFGNQSKYERVRPSLYPAHHLAFIPSLPDVIQDVYMKIYGIPATAAVLTFLRRELMQAIILLILDTDDFMYIYIHGQIVECGDGVRRRDFPRFIIWSADYVEKVLLACIKYLARCHCPRCRINKDHTIELGTRADIYRRNKIREDNDDVVYRITLARRWIFEEGMPLTSVYLDRILGDLSLTPTRSAMSNRLREHGFNHYSLFVPDFLHEFELGVWKSIFTHFMRILYAAGGDKIQEFNTRFRQVPPFGRSTIRRFSTNVSDQGKLAARDYEDRLQCFMPVWEALLPRVDDRITSDLTFDLCMFLSLGKLRAHVPDTLDSLDDAAVAIGRDVRTFANKTCKKYETVELPQESAARGRREARLASQGKSVQGKRGRNFRNFNPKTYKLHALMDYASTCRMYGPTDNTSTQTGECEHCRIKRLYERTNKHKHVSQIARHARRGDKLQIIHGRVNGWRIKLRAKMYQDKRSRAHGGEEPSAVPIIFAPPSQSSKVPMPGDPSEDVVGCSPELHYHIAESRRNPINISNWTFAHKGDPALKGFMLNLQNHILGRLANRFGPTHTPDEDQAIGEFAFSDRSRLVIHHGHMYPHQILRLNYTTYDLRRSQDIINPRTHGDIMLLSGHDPDTDGSSSNHGYEYARVLKIFHVNVRLQDSSMTAFERMDVLLVRWFRVDRTVRGGFKAKRLYRLEFTPTDDDHFAFGFVDPSDVVRASHIIPAFAHGRTDELLSQSIARDVAVQTQEDSDNKDTDFRYHYVNFFADRDIFMRYYGGGIGHRGNARSRAVDTAMDDEDITSEWPDVDQALADAQAAEEEYAQRLAEEPDALLRLVPEIAGGVRKAIFEEVQQHLRSGSVGGDGVGEMQELLAGDEDDLESEDGDGENLLGDTTQGGDEPLLTLDEYALEGYAPP